MTLAAGVPISTPLTQASCAVAAPAVAAFVQGKLLKLLAKKVEFCYAPPSISPLYVSKTAAYSTGMQPGSASWNFFKTAQLAAPFTNNIASLFRGDTAVSGVNLYSRQMGGQR